MRTLPARRTGRRSLSVRFATSGSTQQNSTLTRPTRGQLIRQADYLASLGGRRMRVSIVSILLAGSLVALGACGTSPEPVNLTQAERAEVCGRVARAKITPTGRETGDVRNDYACGSVHATNAFDTRDRRAEGPSRSRAVDRSLKKGY